MFKKIVSIILCISFIFSGLQPLQASENMLPPVGQLFMPVGNFMPLTLKGLIIHPEDALKFDFIIDTGNTGLRVEVDKPALQEESTKLMKYFLTALTIPEEDLWVNLSPFENGKIIESNLGQTLMGKDLLAQDYILKQLTASVIYPEQELGQQFWKKVYEKAQKELGTTSIPVNTFNKVWIVPQEAVVWERDQKVMIVKSRLKVMLEEDYLAINKNIVGTGPRACPNCIGQPQGVAPTDIIRNLVIPILEQQVNEGAHFGKLRQMYQAMILATWYKKRLKESIINRVYANQKKISGINGVKQKEIEAIYQQYVQSFKKGAFNYIKEETEPLSGQKLPRKYFSGGFTAFVLGGLLSVLTMVNPPQAIAETTGDVLRVKGRVVSSQYTGEITNFSNYQLYGFAFLGIGLGAYIYWRNYTISGVLYSEKGAIREEKLKNLLSKKNTEDLVKLLTHKKAIVSKWVANILGERTVENKQLITVELKKLMRDDDVQVRFEASEALRRIYTQAGLTEDQIAEKFSQSREEFINYYLAQRDWDKLISMGSEVEPYLEASLEDKDNKFRRLVINTMGRIRDNRALAPLLRILKRDNEIYEVRLAAAEAILEVGTYEHYQVLQILFSQYQDLIRLKRPDEKSWDFLKFLDDAIKLNQAGKNFKLMLIPWFEILGFSLPLTPDDKELLSTMSSVEDYLFKRELYLISENIIQGGKVSFRTNGALNLHEDKKSVTKASADNEQVIKTPKDLNNETDDNLLKLINSGITNSIDRNNALEILRNRGMLNMNLPRLLKNHRSKVRREVVAFLNPIPMRDYSDDILIEFLRVFEEGVVIHAAKELKERNKLDENTLIFLMSNNSQLVRVFAATELKQRKWNIETQTQRNKVLYFLNLKYWDELNQIDPGLKETEAILEITKRDGEDGFYNYLSAVLKKFNPSGDYLINISVDVKGRQVPTEFNLDAPVTSVQDSAMSITLPKKLTINKPVSYFRFRNAVSRAEIQDGAKLTIQMKDGTVKKVIFRSLDIREDVKDVPGTILGDTLDIPSQPIRIQSQSIKKIIIDQAMTIRGEKNSDRQVTTMEWKVVPTKETLREMNVAMEALFKRNIDSLGRSGQKVEFRNLEVDSESLNLFLSQYQPSIQIGDYIYQLANSEVVIYRGDNKEGISKDQYLVRYLKGEILRLMRVVLGNIFFSRFASGNGIKEVVLINKFEISKVDIKMLGSSNELGFYSLNRATGMISVVFTHPHIGALKKVLDPEKELELKFIENTFRMLLPVARAYFNSDTHPIVELPANNNWLSYDDLLPEVKVGSKSPTSTKAGNLLRFIQNQGSTIVEWQLTHNINYKQAEKFIGSLPKASPTDLESLKTRRIMVIGAGGTYYKFGDPEIRAFLEENQSTFKIGQYTYQLMKGEIKVSDQNGLSWVSQDKNLYKYFMIATYLTMVQFMYGLSRMGSVKNPETLLNALLAAPHSYKVTFTKGSILSKGLTDDMEYIRETGVFKRTAGGHEVVAPEDVIEQYVINFQMAKSLFKKEDNRPVLAIPGRTNLGDYDFLLKKDSAMNAQELKDRYVITKEAIDGTPGSFIKIFGNDHPVRLEIGFGRGFYLLEQALTHPDINFLGVEIPSKNLGSLSRQTVGSGVNLMLELMTTRNQLPPNLKLIESDIRDLTDKTIPDSFIDQIGIYFPNPPPTEESGRVTPWIKLNDSQRTALLFPDSQEHRNQMVGNLLRILKPKGKIEIVTDVPAYASWIVEGFKTVVSERDIVNTDQIPPGVPQQHLMPMSFTQGGETKLEDKIFREGLFGKPINQDFIIRARSYVSITKPDKALVSELPIGQESPGGIDLDAKKLSLQVKQDKDNLPINLADQNIDLTNIQGFEPQIIEIKAVDLPVLLGVSK